MQLRPEEISAVIKEQIKNYRVKIDMDGERAAGI